MKTVCEENRCTGCMACIGKCAKNAIKIQDNLYAYNAVIDEQKCVNCMQCEQVCPNNYPIIKCKPTKWYQGWAEDISIRSSSSSGGVAAAMMKTFIDRGGYVASCLFSKGDFLFNITNDIEVAQKFVGSKYVKSNPIGIYSKIEEHLKAKEKVLFIGLPCQVAGLKNYIKRLDKSFQDNLYTVDLICHGTPSPRLLEQFLKEKRIKLSELDNIGFRRKNQFGLSSNTNNDIINLEPERVQDMYTFAFMMSYDYTENCYTCPYATFQRISDITLGDSWGTNLSKTEQEKGISLILCQTEKGEYLIAETALALRKVDINNAMQANHQLRHPSIRPPEREKFFRNIDKGFHKSMSKCVPKFYYKQKIKKMLIKLKILRGGVK